MLSSNKDYDIFFKNLSFYFFYLKLFLFFYKNNLLFANYIRDTELEIALKDWSNPIFKAAKLILKK